MFACGDEVVSDKEATGWRGGVHAPNMCLPGGSVRLHVQSCVPGFAAARGLRTHQPGFRKSWMCIRTTRSDVPIDKSAPHYGRHTDEVALTRSLRMIRPRGSTLRSWNV